MASAQACDEDGSIADLGAGDAGDTSVAGVSGVESADIEERLAVLARAAGPLRCAATAIAGRMIGRRSWERLGYARIGDYARERLGQSGRTLTEWGRVERALRNRPQLRETLVLGTLPWSKVRLLARFEPGSGRGADRRDARGELPGWSVDEAEEASWVAHAARVSVRTLEHAVRVVDRGAAEVSAALETDEEGISTEQREWVHVRGSARMAFAWNHACRMSSKVAGQRIAPADALELVTAEVLSALPVALDDVVDGVDTEGGIDAAGASSSVRSTEGLVEERHGAGLLAGRSLMAESTSLRTGGSAFRAGSEPGENHVEVGENAASAERNTTHPGNPSAIALLCQGADVTAPSPPELPAFVQSLIEGLEDADAFELDARLRRVVRLEQRLDAEIAPLLRRVVDDRRARRSRRGRTDSDGTLASYARDRLGMSPRKARALVRLEKLSDSCPELRSAFREGELSWVQAQVLAPLLIRVAEDFERPVERGGKARQADWRKKWIAAAQQISVRRLEDIVRRALVTGELTPEPARQEFARAEEDPASPQSEDTKRQTGARPTYTDMAVRVGIHAPRDVARLFRATLCAVRKLLEPRLGRMPDEGEAFEAMIEHALSTWEAEDPSVRRSRPGQSPLVSYGSGDRVML